MSSDSDAIRRVIEAFEKSDWSEVDVRVGSIRVHLRAGEPADAKPAPGAIPAPDANPSPGAPDDGRGPATPSDPTADTSAPAPSNASASADLPDGAFVVRSPSPGIFWRSPQPGAPPFADIDQHVDANSTLCIVEVMKLMNHVKGGVAGAVVAVFGRDGVAVQKDEPLFAIDPAVSAT